MSPLHRNKKFLMNLGKKNTYFFYYLVKIQRIKFQPNLQMRMPRHNVKNENKKKISESFACSVFEI